MKKYSLLLFLIIYTTVAFSQAPNNPDYLVYYDGPDLQLASTDFSCSAPCMPKPGACTYYRYLSDLDGVISEPSLSCDFIGVSTIKEQRIIKAANAACQSTETISTIGQFLVTGVNFAWISTPPSSCPNGSSINLGSYFSYPSGTAFSGPGVSANVFYPQLSGPGNHVITATRVFANGMATRTTTIRVYGALPIATQPVSKVVCPGGTFFAVTASPNVAPLSYQWQSSPNGTSWTDISNSSVYSGATTSNLSIDDATPALEGYRYRVNLQDACGSSSKVTSNTATLTFHTPVSYSQYPPDRTACAGSTATFGVIAAGTGLTYQWQASYTGTNWVDLTDNLTYSGTKTNTLAVLSDASLNSLRFRVVTTGTCGAYFSNTALLTVTTGPAITGSPSPVIACEGTTASFTVAASGSSLTYQWQYSASGGTGTFTDITSATSSTYSRTSLLPIAAGFYRAMVKSSCGSTGVPSGSAQLIVNAATRISVPPNDEQVCVGGNIQFSATGEGFGLLTYQWEVSTNGGSSYTLLSNSVLYAGVATSTLRITGATMTMHNYRYRIRVTGTCGTVLSTGAILTVNAFPAVPTVTSPARCGSGVLTSTANSGAASPTFQWYANPTDLTPVYTGQTYTISNLTSTNTFHVSVVSAGCESSKVQTTFTRHATQNVSLGAPLTLCSGQGVYNLENDIESLPAKGSNFTWTANSTNFTSKIFDPAVGSGSYVVSYSPPASAQAVPNCFITTTRTINVVSSASGDGGIVFNHPAIYNGSVMNLCIGDSPVDLTSFPSVPGGSWTAVSGTGLSYSANAVIFTPNQTSYTTIEPNVFRYTLQVNGCTATKDLSIYVKDNQSVPVVSGVPSVVCPGQRLALVASVITPGTFSFNWYKAGESAPFATTSNLSFPVTRQESLQVRSINGSFGCQSAAKVVDIITPFSSGTIAVDKRTIAAGDFVSFSTDASETGNTFMWDFADGASSTERSPTHYYYAPGEYAVRLNINSNLGCAQAIEYKNVTVSGEPVNVITGTFPTEVKVIHVFPNPVTDQIKVTSDQEILSCLLYDLRGHSVLIEKTAASKNDLTISAYQLLPGMYVLHVRTREKSIQYKIFKK